MPKKQTGFKKAIPKKLDSPQAEEFIEAAGQKPAKTRSAPQRPAAAGLDLLREIFMTLKAFDPQNQIEGIPDPVRALKILLEQILLWEKMEKKLAEKKLLAERRAGEILKGMKDRPPGLDQARLERLASLADLPGDRFEKLLKTRQAESEEDMKIEAQAQPPEEIMDDDFKQAVDRMIQAIKKADEKGWQTTSKKTALRYIEMFRHMITIDGLD